MRPAQRRARHWRWAQQDKLRGVPSDYERARHHQRPLVRPLQRDALMTLWLALAAGTGLIAGIAIATVR